MYVILLSYPISAFSSSYNVLGPYETEEEAIKVQQFYHDKQNKYVEIKEVQPSPEVY